MLSERDEQRISYDAFETITPDDLVEDVEDVAQRRRQHFVRDQTVIPSGEVETHNTDLQLQLR